MVIFHCYVSLPEGIPGERPEKGCNASMFQARRPGGFSRGLRVECQDCKAEKLGTIVNDNHGILM